MECQNNATVYRKVFSLPVIRIKFWMTQYWESLSVTSNIQRKSEQNLTFENRSRSPNETKMLSKMKHAKRRFHVLKSSTLQMIKTNTLSIKQWELF